MNVSVDWEPGGQPQRPRRPSQGPNRPGKKPGDGRFRRRNVQLVGAVGVGLVALVVAALAVPNKHGGHKPSPSPSPSPAASSPTPGGLGLPRGTASAFGLDGSTRVSSLPRGFAHSTDGAVEAATTVSASVFTVERMTSSDRAAYLTSVYGKEPAGAESDAQAYQQQNHLNAQGQLVDAATGQPSDSQHFSSLCHPELGAYRVVNSGTDKVSVDVWQVCLSGVIGPSGPDLQTQWTLGQFEMRWTQGDWQIASTNNGGFTAPPTPEKSGTAVTTYAQRAQILASSGTGWELYSDATDKPVAEMGATQ